MRIAIVNGLQCCAVGELACGCSELTADCVDSARFDYRRAGQTCAGSVSCVPGQIADSRPSAKVQTEAVVASKLERCFNELTDSAAGNRMTSPRRHQGKLFCYIRQLTADSGCLTSSRDGRRAI